MGEIKTFDFDFDSSVFTTISKHFSYNKMNPSINLGHAKQRLGYE